MPDRFDGFPAGELQYVSVPDLFFTGLVPSIDNLAELKVVLHSIWLRQRRGRQVLTLAELATDETLIAGLSSLGDDPMCTLEDGLTRAVARGALLHAVMETAAGEQDIYVVNSEGGRQTFEEAKQGRLGLEGVVVVDRPAVEPRPNIFELYEDNIGLISPLLADELREAEVAYPADWIEDAFRIAVNNNARKWGYVRAILERWATAGKDESTVGRKPETEKRWYTDEEFEQFFRH
jgi:DNA replication protein